MLVTLLKDPQKRQTVPFVQEVLAQISSQPIGFGEFQLMEFMPSELASSLPSIEQIRHELAGNKHE